MQAPNHPQEAERLEVVHRLSLMDSGSDPRFDALTKEATERLKVPISTISILDEHREWYKSCQGLEVSGGPRSIAFCSWALLSTDVFIVEDALLDERFKHNPYVVGAPYIRFYAGLAIYDAVSGLPIGVFCVKDTKPRTLSVAEMGILFELARKAEILLNQR